MCKNTQTTICHCGNALESIYEKFQNLCVECERFEENSGMSSKFFKPRPSIHFPEIESTLFTDTIL